MVFAAVSHKLPNEEHPVLFYSNQQRQDLKQVFAHAIKNAKKSIHLYMYAVTDPELIGLLTCKAEEGIPISIFLDPKTSSEAKLQRNGYLGIYPIESKGLMHRKILVIDEELVFLGSANMTTQSLKIHDNLVIGISNPHLAHALTDPSFLFLNFQAGKQSGELFLLPDKTNASLERILDFIKGAEKNIYIAMFTLTHPKIIDALAEAHQRNIDVKVAVDFYTGKGASLRSLDTLRAKNIPVFLSRGQQLLHHKWAYIDDSILIAGSANWTKAAFSRNQDCFLILNNLNEEQRKFMNKIWKTIYLESCLY